MTRAERRHHHEGRDDRPAECERERGGEGKERSARVSLQIEEGKEHDRGGERRTHDGGGDSARRLGAAIDRIRSRSQPVHHHQSVLNQDSDTHAEPGERQQVGGDLQQVQT